MVAGRPEWYRSLSASKPSALKRRKYLRMVSPPSLSRVAIAGALSPQLARQMIGMRRKGWAGAVRE